MLNVTGTIMPDGLVDGLGVGRMERETVDVSVPPLGLGLGVNVYVFWTPHVVLISMVDSAGLPIAVKTVPVLQQPLLVPGMNFFAKLSMENCTSTTPSSLMEISGDEPQAVFFEIRAAFR